MPYLLMSKGGAGQDRQVVSCQEYSCVVLQAPYPNNPNPVETFNVKTNFDLQGDGLVWYVRPQLFFNCTLCPTVAKGTLYCGSHKEVSLVLASWKRLADSARHAVEHMVGICMYSSL